MKANPKLVLSRLQRADMALRDVRDALTDGEGGGLDEAQLSAARIYLGAAGSRLAAIRDVLVPADAK